MLAVSHRTHHQKGLLNTYGKETQWKDALEIEAAR